MAAGTPKPTPLGELQRSLNSWLNLRGRVVPRDGQEKGKEGEGRGRKIMGGKAMQGRIQNV